MIVSPPEGDAAHGFSRAVRTRLQPGWEAMFSSPEDSIVSKMEFFREGGSEKHLRDIAGILRNPNLQLDLDYVTSEASRLGRGYIWVEIRAGRKPRHEADDPQ